MKQPILSLRIAFLFLLTVSLLNLPSAAMAGSAAQIASQVEILQDTSKGSQERSAAAQELGVVGLDSDKMTQGILLASDNTDSDEEANVGDPDEEANVGDADEEANVGDPDEEANLDDPDEEANVGDPDEEANVDDPDEEANVDDPDEEANAGDPDED